MTTSFSGSGLAINDRMSDLSTEVSLPDATLNPLQDLKDFPFEIWTAQNSHYLDLNQWFMGQPLTATVYDEETGTEVDQYPLRLNPIPKTCERHVSVLLGTKPDSVHYGSMQISPLPKAKDKNDKKTVADIKHAIQTVFEENGGGATILSNAFISQRLGGCVFQASYNYETGKFRISNPSPHEFIGIPDGDDLWNLREAWIVKTITELGALAYGVDVANSNQPHYYVEHWQRDKIEITIDSQPIKLKRYSPKPRNIWGFVPIVYIPHLRVGTAFLGRPVLTQAAKGIILEINDRWADFGDAVNEEAHRINAIRNVHENLGIERIGGWRLLNLGNKQAFGNDGDPDLITSQNSTATSTSMLSFGDKLIDAYRREVDHPAVADGEDQGSQRSSLTLTTRMWPLVSHVENERTFWSVGLTVFEKMLLKMMSIKGMYDITEKHLECSLTQKWATMLPRDRKDIVDEAAIRSKNHLGTMETLLEFLGDIPDVQQEVEAIKAEMKEEAKNSKLRFQANNPPNPNQGNGQSDGIDNKLK